MAESDGQLVARAQTGDTVAFDELVRILVNDVAVGVQPSPLVCVAPSQLGYVEPGIEHGPFVRNIEHYGPRIGHTDQIL